MATAEFYRAKFPEMPEEQVQRIVEADKKMEEMGEMKLSSTDWDAMICESCQ